MSLQRKTQKLNVHFKFNNMCKLKVLTFLSNHSLAQQDPVLQTLHEVVPNPFAGHILNPQPQLLFLLGVVLPCKLADGWNTGQRSNIRLDSVRHLT